MGVANFQGKYTKARTLWLFDSFQGLPCPSEEDGDLEKGDYFKEWNKGDVEKVKQVFIRFGLAMHNVRIIPGGSN